MTRHRGNGGPRSAKPPYNPWNAFHMGWPCVPPYRMKSTKKQRWIALWETARIESGEDA